MSTGTSVVVFGATGQLGARLTEALGAAGYDVTALDRTACDFAVADARKIDTTLRALEPALIINAAAYTAVDKAESERELAHHVNAQVPAWLASHAMAHTIPLVHFSTDYVFDGVRGRYREDAAQRPLNVYGETKQAGEEAVLAAGGYVFRIQWVYDIRGRNFLLAMKPLLESREELRIVADQMGAPTAARDIAAAITQLVPDILSGTLPPAAYHLAARGYTSWHGFACAIAAAIGSKTRIVPITTAEYPLPATRPLDGRLNCTALATYGVEMPHWRNALNALLEENASA